MIALEDKIRTRSSDLQKNAIPLCCVGSAGLVLLELMASTHKPLLKACPGTVFRLPQAIS
jgi:hypothetical protein